MPSGVARQEIADECLLIFAGKQQPLAEPARNAGSQNLSSKIVPRIRAPHVSV